MRMPANSTLQRAEFKLGLGSCHWLRMLVRTQPTPYSGFRLDEVHHVVRANSRSPLRLYFTQLKSAIGYSTIASHPLYSSRARLNESHLQIKNKGNYSVLLQKANSLSH